METTASFTKSLYRKTAKGEKQISVLIVDANGNGDGFRSLPASSATFDHIKELISCRSLELYPFQMKFKGKLYDIACNENGMAENKPAVFTPHTAGMVAGDCKVDFIINDGSGRLADLGDLELNGIIPIHPFTGKHQEERMPKDSITGTVWAFHHFGPIAFVEANTGWIK